MDNGTVLVAGDTPWSALPTDILIAELARRQDAASPEERPACGSRDRGSYDTPLHIFALILILTLSTLACGFPLLSSRASKNRRSSRVIWYCQHFGTGVLLATAFVHLLPTAFSSLTDPCLPYFFSKGYTPLPGLVAMVSALVVVSIESYLTTRGAGHSHSHHGHGWDSDDESEDETSHTHVNGNGNASTNGLAAKRASNHRPTDIALQELGDREGLMAGVSPLPESTPISTPISGGEVPSIRKTHEADDDDLDLDLDELEPSPEDDSRPLTRTQGIAEPVSPGIQNPDEQKRLLIQCLLLEAGILFHSIFIGMAVSVATGPPFIVFLIAISFHQTFEGLALGSRIAAIHFPKRSIRPWLMVLAYGTTTPLGQVIGLIVHKLYDPMSQTGLLMVGFMNAISSGLLLFAGLVQLLAEDFLSEKSYKTLKGRSRTHAFLSVVGGATLMALVGAWA